MLKRPTRPKYRPGQPVISRELPEGWTDHPFAYGAITPIAGQWKGMPMRPDSTMAKLLGWPGKCLQDINHCYRYPDDTESVPVFKDGVIVGRKRKRFKDPEDPPSIKASAGWIDTGLIQLAWVDRDGNKDPVDYTCRQRKRLSRKNTDRATRVLPKKTRPSY